MPIISGGTSGRNLEGGRNDARPLLSGSNGGAFDLGQQVMVYQGGVYQGRGTVAQRYLQNGQLAYIIRDGTGKASGLWGAAELKGV